MFLRLVCISDTHLQHGFNVPDGDILIHAGDMTSIGNFPQLMKFHEWIRRLPHQKKICIAGNHDWLCETDPALARSLLQDVIYLDNNETVIAGVKFYGSPYQPEFNNWAFNLNRCSNDLKENWDKIPDDVNVLITHGPPMDILDCLPSSFEHCGKKKLGCYDLAQRIKQLKQLKLHVFGHIHAGYGELHQEGVRYINASVCNERYQPVNAPIVIDYGTEI